jgi:peptidoglycan/xylan/chitin deacetylase (PgdA/CDA1 family)
VKRVVILTLDGGGSSTRVWSIMATTSRARDRRVEEHLEPGAIILMHIGAATNGATLDTSALPAVIAAVRRHGYSFTTFASLRRAQ